MSARVIQEKLHVSKRGRIRQISLIKLQDMRNIGEIQFQSQQVAYQIHEAFSVLEPSFFLGIGHEDYSVHTAEYKLFGGIVYDRARHRVHLKLYLKPSDWFGSAWRYIEV